MTTIAMADDDYDGEGTGLEVFHISDFLDYLGKTVRLNNYQVIWTSCQVRYILALGLFNNV